MVNFCVSVKFKTSNFCVSVKFEMANFCVSVKFKLRSIDTLVYSTFAYEKLNSN